MNEQIYHYLFIAIAALISLTLHEVSHGYVAYLLGDNTAKSQGRLSLNPIKHIDLFGLIALIVIRIGWAKPVPINSMNFASRKKGMLLTSFAGPGMNFFLACYLTYSTTRTDCIIFLCYFIIVCILMSHWHYSIYCPCLRLTDQKYSLRCSPISLKYSFTNMNVSFISLS